MRWPSKFAVLLGLSALLTPAFQAATISGTIRGPNGTPFEGAFVQAQNTKSNIKDRYFYIAADSQRAVSSELLRGERLFCLISVVVAA
jgi:hypothetical protein